MNRLLMLALKIAVLAAVFVIIFYTINWRDSYSLISVEGDTLSQIQGRILGTWNSESVRFLPDGASVPQEIQQETKKDGTQTIISPGFLTYIKNIDLLRFALGAMFFFIFVIIINTRWWWLLRLNRIDIGFFEAQCFAWIGIFSNNILPGSTGGDVVKAVYVAKRCSINRVAALVSIVVDRIVGLVSLLFVGGLASLLAIDRFPAFAVIVWLTAIGALLICTLLLSPGLRQLFRFERLIDRLPKRLGGIVSEVDHAVLQYREHLRSISTWILISPLVYSLFVASLYFMDRSLGVGLTYTDYFFIGPVVSVVQGIPISPAGWGIGEAAYGTLIGKFGAMAFPDVPEAEQMMRTRGVALSILHRSHIVVWSLLGGILMLIYRHKPTNLNAERQQTDAQSELQRIDDENQS